MSQSTPIISGNEFPAEVIERMRKVKADHDQAMAAGQPHIDRILQIAKIPEARKGERPVPMVFLKMFIARCSLDDAAALALLDLTPSEQRRRMAAA